MLKVQFVCPECDSEFSVHYNSEICEDVPKYCSFCSSYIVEDTPDYDDEEDD